MVNLNRLKVVLCGKRLASGLLNNWVNQIVLSVNGAVIVSGPTWLLLGKIAKMLDVDVKSLLNNTEKRR